MNAMTKPDDLTSVLFQPIRINQLIINSRLVMGPIAAHWPAPDGRPSEETIAFFERRARGGAGLIIVGGTISTARAWDGKPRVNQTLRLDKDEYISDLRRLTDAVHGHAVPMFAQINVGMGRVGRPGPHFTAASAVNLVIPEESLAGVITMPGGMTTAPPREVTREEIADIEREASESALRTRTAGFDGVEIGAHMSYFFASFLSPRTNRRTDDYGGPVENRIRILVNIIRRIRAVAGAEFPIGVRMSASERVAGGQGPNEYASIARLLEQAGVDYIALTTGGYEVINFHLQGDACLVRRGEAQIFRQALSIPIMLQGIHDPAEAAAAITAGHGDIVMLARPMLADPEYPNKVRQGRLQEIVRCDKGNVCLRRLLTGLPIRCPLNPRLGSETTQQSGVSRVVEAAALKLSSSRFFMGQMARLANPRPKRP